MLQKIFKISLFLIPAILLVLFIYPNKFSKQLQKKAKTQWLILNGKLKDARTAHLWIECRGAGNPTVILDAGLNMTRESWGEIPAGVSKFTRVCVYERAGLGDSESIAGNGRTSREIVAELATLLENADEKPPFLLAGHSFGGFNTRLFAATFPQKTAGLILIDASSEDEFEIYSALKNGAEKEKYLLHESGANYERINLLESARQVREASEIKGIPIVVLSAEGDFAPPEQELKEAHLKLQQNLARKLSAEQYIFVPNSGHFVQQDNPDVVLKAIRNLTEKLK